MQRVSLDRDPLSDFFNRRYVIDEIEEHIKRYGRHRRPFSLLVVDIHNTARLNETFGQAAADAILGDLADLISTKVREVDVWFLCATDQFIVVMDETDSRAAQVVARRLAGEAWNATFTQAPTGLALDITFSTASCPEDAVEAEMLLRAVGLLRRSTDVSGQHPPAD
jgi:two-component system cell cycle response regulator